MSETPDTGTPEQSTAEWQEPHQVRITSSGKIQAWVTFALEFLEVGCTSGMVNYCGRLTDITAKPTTAFNSTYTPCKTITDGRNGTASGGCKTWRAAGLAAAHPTLLSFNVNDSTSHFSRGDNQT